MAKHNEYLSCHIEKNVPIAFILPSRWQDGAESLGIERPHKLSMSVSNWADMSLHLLLKNSKVTVSSSSSTSSSYQNKEEIEDEEWSAVLALGHQPDRVLPAELVRVGPQRLGNGQKFGKGVRVGRPEFFHHLQSKIALNKELERAQA